MGKVLATEPDMEEIDVFIFRDNHSRCVFLGDC